MKAVGIKRLKSRLSEYVRLARAGETILVTEREQVVAELRPARRQALPSADIEDVLDTLTETGEVTRASVSRQDWTWRAKGAGLPRGTALALLDDVRADRRVG